MNDKVNCLKKEITRINTFYGTQLIEKNAKIKDLEDNNTKLEGQLIQTISFNLIGENPINTQLNSNNLEENGKIFNSNTVNKNIFNDYNKVQSLSANKKKNNPYKFYRINNTQDFNSYSGKKSNNEKFLSITHFQPKKETLIINVIKESVGSSVDYTSNDDSSPHQKKLLKKNRN